MDLDTGRWGHKRIKNFLTPGPNNKPGRADAARGVVEYGARAPLSGERSQERSQSITPHRLQRELDHSGALVQYAYPYGTKMHVTFQLVDWRALSPMPHHQTDSPENLKCPTK